MARPSPSECLSLVRVGLIASLGPCCWLFEVQESFPDLSCVTQSWGRPNTTVAESRAQVFRNRRIIPRISLLPVLTIYRSRCAGKSKGGELEESLPKFALAQEKKNGCERYGEGKQREHYEYELQGRHTPYVRALYA